MKSSLPLAVVLALYPPTVWCGELTARPAVREPRRWTRSD